jgi:hypothetical protein
MRSGAVHGCEAESGGGLPLRARQLDRPNALLPPPSPPQADVARRPLESPEHTGTDARGLWQRLVAFLQIHPPLLVGLDCWKGVASSRTCCPRGRCC